MKKWNILLSILLLFQAGLVILSATITTDIKAITIDQPLLNFRTEHIDTVNRKLLIFITPEIVEK